MISLDSIGKKLLDQWIFKNLTTTISTNDKVAIIGNNGSGKSTLIQLISGYISPTTGTIHYSINGNTIDKQTLYRYIALGSPYIDLPEELNARELISTFGQLKPFIEHSTPTDLLKEFDLAESSNKPIKYFSSGMKQRLKVGMAILSSTPILLLDEPLTNLDDKGTQWYQELIEKYGKNKTILVASNEIKEELTFCTSTIDVRNYK